MLRLTLFIAVACTATARDATVVTVPSLTLSPKTESMPFLHSAGDEFTLLCRLNGGRLSELQWYRDGQPLDEGWHRYLQRFDGGESLSLPMSGQPIESLLHIYSGSYHCEALTSVVTDTGATVRMRQISNTYDAIAAHSAPFMRRAHAARHWPSRVDAVQGQTVHIPCPYDALKSAPTPPNVWFEFVPTDTGDEGGDDDGAERRRRLWQMRSRRRTKTPRRRRVPISEPPIKITNTTNTDRFLLTMSGLQIALTQPSDKGKYRCVIQNPITGTTHHQKGWTRLRVGRPPSAEITSPGPVIFQAGSIVYPFEREQVILVAAGEGVWLSCVASEGRVQWHKINSTVPVADIRNVEIKWGNVHIIKANSVHDGTYECRAAPLVGEQPASQLGYVPLSASRALYHVRVVQPSKVELGVSATSDASAIRITCAAPTTTITVSPQPELFIDGARIFDRIRTLPVRRVALASNPIEVELAADERSLSIGVQCVAASAFNVTGVAHSSLLRGASSSAFLQVDVLESPIEAPPTAMLLPDGEEKMKTGDAFSLHIKTAPSNTTAYVGDTVTLVCIVEGPLLAVHWYKDIHMLHIGANMRANLLGTGTLELRDIQESDAAWYSCVAVDYSGQNVTAQAYLTVLGDIDDASTTLEAPPAPKLLSTVPTTTTTARTTTTITTETSTTSTTEPSVQDDEIFASSTPTTTTPESTTIAEETTKPAVYVIDEVLDFDGPDVYALNEHAVQLEWQLPPSLQKSAKYLKVQYRPADSDNWLTIDERVMPTANGAKTLSDMPTEQSYVFRIVAFTKIGSIQSAHSDIIELKRATTTKAPVITAKATTPPRHAPTLLKANALDKDRIEVVWTHGDDSTSIHGFLIQYHMVFAASGENDDDFVEVQVHGDDKRSYVVDDLLPDTPYKIQVLAYNDLGRSPASNARIVYTKAPGTKASGERVVVRPQAPQRSFLATIAGLLGRHLSRENEMFVIVALALVGITILFVCCLCCCVCRQRRQQKMIQAANGRYDDTAQRVYKTQKTATLRGRPVNQSEYAQLHVAPPVSPMEARSRSPVQPPVPHAESFFPVPPPPKARILTSANVVTPSHSVTCTASSINGTLLRHSVMTNEMTGGYGERMAPRGSISDYDMHAQEISTMYGFPTLDNDPLPPPPAPIASAEDTSALLSSSSNGTPRHTFLLSPPASNAPNNERRAGSGQSTATTTSDPRETSTGADGTPATPSRVSTFKPDNNNLSGSRCGTMERASIPKNGHHGQVTRP